MELETIISILSIVIPILSSIIYLGFWIGRKFGEIDERFRAVDERFKVVDDRFRLLENRFDELKRYVDTRFDELKKYVDDRLIELKNYVDNRFNDLRSYIDNRVERIGRAFSSYQEFLIEYLSMKGVVSEKEVTILKNEAVRMSLLASLNPFTKEEWEKLKKYLDKDPNDFTLEEAEEFRELGRKAIREYWDRPEAYKLHMYTCVVYGLTLRKLDEKEKKKESQKTC
jgi:DNA mismatch repair ATPase MutS